MKREQKYQENLVSVIMPAYNAADTIAESIDSVLSQTYTEWELLIIDDASTDETRDIAGKYAEKDKRIRCLYQEQNQGVAAARNRGIHAARGRYLAFLDSDDLWMPEKLKRQLAFMCKNCYAFTYTWYNQFISNPKQIGRLVRTKSQVGYKELLKGNDIGCLTVMLDRRTFSDVHMPVQFHEDYITWLTLLKSGEIAYSLPERLAMYRIGNGKALTGNKWKSLVGTWRVYRESQRLSLFQSAFCMLFYICSGIRKHV